MVGSKYYDDRQVVDEHAAMFEHLVGVALSERESVDLIRTIGRSYR